MLSWIIQISIISIIFIFLVHHLLCFFKTTLTVPKIKDLVNSPNKKYQQIFDTISNGNDSNTYSNTNNNANSYTELDLLPSATDIETNINTNNNANATNATNANSMKNELKHFLKKQLNNEKETTLDTMSSNNNNYAAFL